MGEPRPQMDSFNARDYFINYTISRGYNVDSWEFGNKLSGDGVNAKVDVQQYSEDLITLKALIDDLYQDKPKPMVVALGGFYDQDWFAKMLQISGPNVVDVVTHHIYDHGPVQRQREDYHLTAKDGNLTSYSMLLNGKLIKFSSSGEIPKITPSINDASAPIHIAPSSIVFAKFMNSNAPACYDIGDLYFCSDK